MNRMQIQRLQALETWVRDGVDLTTEELRELRDLRAASEAIDRRNADRIDGYDRDDLGESPDF